jgi:hypothetical protein
MASTNTAPLLLLKELKEIMIGEKQNAESNIALLQPHLSAGDLVLRMYQMLFESLLIAKDHDLQNDVFNFLISLVGSCQRGFIVGMDRLLKGYYNDSYNPLRLSIEASCVAYKGHCHPHLIPLWLESIDGDDEYREYQNKFAKRFAGNEPALLGLKDIYDECSTYSHANPFGVGKFVRLTGDRIEVGYFDLKYERELIGAFWTTIDGHWFIIALMLPIFKEFMSKDMKLLLCQNFVGVNNASGKSSLGEDEKLRQSVITNLIQ